MVGLQDNARVGVVLDQTNFYAESGGQQFDAGIIHSSSGLKFVVDEVHSYGGFVLHVGTIESGVLKKGEQVVTEIDIDVRRPIMANHTSTHMVNFALRQVLGGGVDQQGT